VIALAALGLAPWAFWRGGIVEREATTFIPSYLDGRGLLRKVFDPRTNDFGLYQARELSHLADLVDAHALDAVHRATGWAPFVPLSAAVSSLALILVTIHMTARAFPRLSPATARLALLLFMSQFVYLSTSGVYYRSTKALVCPLLFALLFRLAAEARGTLARPAAFSWPVFGLTLALGLADRPGFFFGLGIGLMGLAAHARGVRLTAALRALAAALALVILYDVLLGRAAARWLNGYWPDLSFQRLSPRTLWREPERVLQGVELLAGSARLLLGSLPVWACGLLVLGLALWAWRGRFPLRATPALLTGLSAAGLVVIYAGSIARHWPIYTHADHRLWYYPLPFQAVMVFGLLLGLEAVEARGVGAERRGLQVMLVGLALANVLHWPAHREALRRGPWFPGVEAQTGWLRGSLAGGKEHPSLDADYAKLYAQLAGGRGVE
jgi:hypothetical protein